jgi:hypothetical protein
MENRKKGYDLVVYLCYNGNIIMYGSIKFKKEVYIMPKGNVRSDKKFGVKVWIKSHDKDIFRTHCFNHHLSMMFVAEKYVITCLADFPDKKLEEIIETHLDKFNSINSTKDGYEPLGFRLINEYWQKLAFFAVKYKTSVVKVASCIFEYCLSAYELRGIEEEYGLTFSFNRKKRFENKSFEDGRLSDY